MPVLSMALQDTKDTILRPIMTSIIKQLSDQLGLGKSIPIYYVDEQGSYMQHNSGIHRENTELGSKLSNDEIITIEVDEEWAERFQANTPIWKPDHKPIFIDPELKVRWSPYYAWCDLNITVKIRTKDRTRGEMLRNRLRQRVPYLHEHNHHVLHYYYLIPKEYLYILREIYKRRENIAGYGETFSEYVTGHGVTIGSTRLTNISNMKGNKTRLGIAETQSRVLGHYDFNITPERGEREGDSSRWITSFTYKVGFERPITLSMHYPIIVHQQLLPTPLIPYMSDKTLPWGSYEDGEWEGSDSLRAMDYFSAHRQRQVEAIDKPLIIPKYDEWVCPDANYRRPRIESVVFQTLLTVGDDDSRGELYSLKLIDGVQFSDRMLKFLSDESPYLNGFDGSVLGVKLFNQRGPLHPYKYRIDKDLMIHNLDTLNLRNEYRLRMTVLRKWSLLTESAIDRLRKNPDIVIDLITYLGHDPNEVKNYVRSVLGGGTLHSPEYFYADIKNPYRNLGNSINNYDYGHYRLPDGTRIYTPGHGWIYDKDKGIWHDGALIKECDPITKVCKYSLVPPDLIKDFLIDNVRDQYKGNQNTGNGSKWKDMDGRWKFPNLGDTIFIPKDLVETYFDKKKGVWVAEIPRHIMGIIIDYVSGTSTHSDYKNFIGYSWTLWVQVYSEGGGLPNESINRIIEA